MQKYTPIIIIFCFNINQFQLLAVMFNFFREMFDIYVFRINTLKTKKIIIL